MNSFLMWFGGLLVAVLAALFAVPHFIDWNGYRGVFEEEASRILGRSVRVGGNVNLRLLPSPYVRFEKLRVADSSGLTGEPFFKAESFTMWLSVPPMLKGIMEAERIELDRPVIRLAATQDGVGNWGGFSMQTGALPFVPSGVALDSVNIIDGVLSFDVEGGGRLGQIERINGEVNASSLSGPYSFRGTARRGREDFNVIAALGESSGSRAMSMKIRANRRGNAETYAFDGSFSGFAGAPKIEGDVTSVVAVGQNKKSTRGARSNGGVGLEISLKLSADARQAVLSQINASLDSAGQPQSIVGDARVVWGKRHRMDITLSSAWLDLDHFAGGGILSNRAGEASRTDVMGAGGAGGAGQDGSGSVAVLETGTPSSADTPELRSDMQSPEPGPAGSAQPRDAAVGVVPPWKTVRRLLDGLSDVVPSDLDISAQFHLEQANLGGDALSGLKMVLSRQGGPLNVETLQARLPGSGRLTFSGVMKKTSKGVGLSGDMFVGGPSLVRFKKWALGRGVGSQPLSDGSFSISGRLKLGGKSIALKRARAEFLGVLLRGGVSWSGFEKDGRVSVDLSGQEFDSRWIGMKPVEFSTLLRSLGGGNAELASAGLGIAGDESALSEFSVRLKVGKLINGDEVLHNVNAQMSVSGDKLSIPAISFETPEGLEAQFEGNIADVSKVPSGEIRWVVSAPDKNAAKFIEALIDASSSPEDRERGFVGAAAPFRLAGKLNLGGRMANAADIEMDGEVRGGRFVGQLRFDGGFADWKTKPADITVTVDSPNWRSALEMFALDGRFNPVSGEREPPMRTVFKAVGVPSSGMNAMGLAQSERLTLIYNGSVDAAGSGHGGVTVKSGEIVVAAANVGDVMGLMGLRVGTGISSARVDGLVDLERAGNKLVFRPRDMKIGASTVAGRIELSRDRGSDGTLIIDADVVTDSAHMSGMLSAVLSSAGLQVRDGVGASGDGDGGGAGLGVGVPAPQRARADGPPGAPGAVTQATELAAGVRRNEFAFSDAAFDLSMLGALRGRVVTRIGALSLGQGLVVTGARVETLLKADKVEVVLAAGEAIGGSVIGQVVLKKGRAGVALSGGFVIENASLSHLTRWDETGAAIAMASGRAKMKLEFSGRALSPRAVISVLSGKGEVVLEDARVKGLSPEIVTKTAEEVIARVASGGEEGDASSQASREDLSGALKERLGEGDMELGTRTIAIEIVDGAARFTPFSMKNPHGVTTGRVTFDIGQLAMDSEFKLSAIAKGNQKAWPPVNVVFVGPLGKIGAVEPLVSLAALERELVVRKLEQNVAELERLRRLDEEAAARRRAREQERLKEREAARAAAREEAEALETPGPVVPNAGARAPGAGGTPPGGDGGDAGVGVIDPGTANGLDADGNPVLDPAAIAAREKARRARARARRLRLKKKRAQSAKPRRRTPSAGELLLQQF